MSDEVPANIRIEITPGDALDLAGAIQAEAAARFGTEAPVDILELILLRCPSAKWSGEE